MAKVGSLDVSRLCLGANVFGWTADRETSFAVLDGFVAAGGTMIDTADSYMWRVPGNSGGESETIIGDWMAERGNRDDVVVATKVGSLPTRPGLSAATHKDDPDTAQEETLAAFDALVRAGSVREIGASNFSADRLRSALALSAGSTSYAAAQPHYNLVERAGFETGLAPLLAAEGIACLPYYALAKGFLTGKYRADGPDVTSVRAEGARAYLDDRGVAVLAELDDLAAAHGVSPAAVALAWLAAQPTVAAPIASARTPDQLADLLPALALELPDDELARLTAASS